MATLSLKNQPRRRRHAVQRHTTKPPPTQQANQRFLIVLYTLFAMGAALFLWLIYAVLFI